MRREGSGEVLPVEEHSIVTHCIFNSWSIPIRFLVPVIYLYVYSTRRGSLFSRNGPTDLLGQVRVDTSNAHKHGFKQLVEMFEFLASTDHK